MGQRRDNQEIQTKLTATKNRRRAFFKGKLAEYYAAIYLLLKGYKICQMRYKTKLGEIDIIARKGDLIAVVEVKARNTVQAAVDAVSYESKRRISNAADYWLSRQRDANLLSIRMDIVAVVPWKLPVHLKDAY